MLKFLNHSDAQDMAVISLCEDLPKAPLRADAKFSPKASGYTVFINKNSTNPYAQAGRICATLGLSALKLENSLSLEESYQFALGLDDLTTDIDLSLNLEASDLQKLRSTYEIVYACRKLADTSNATIDPIALVNHAYTLIESSVTSGSLRFDLIDREDERFAKLQGLKAVGSGSVKSPCLGIIDYVPAGMSEDAPVEIALVGKGITFDSGGYDLKGAKFMDTMRTDKTGAVNLAGALALAIKHGLNKHVRLYLCCSQNLVSATSMVPGDIIEYQNGVTVEIGNTDAEGRLVLADGLILASETKAPTIISEATLTGAAKIAIGRDMCALVCRGNVVPPAFLQSFSETNERIWQLPLYDFHDRFISSKRAQWLNTAHGDGAPGVSTAAAFLEKFVTKDAVWMHIDLSSAYLPEGSPFQSSGPSGATIRALAKYLCL
jgi:PepB aminopeptidase